MAAEFNHVKGRVHQLESFGLVDGPGVRFVIFVQGCRMRCRYCHNPETWQIDAGTEWDSEDLFNRAYRFKNYWQDNGGITISGGEPMLQMDFVTDIFARAKEKHVHTALDTCGQPFSMEPAFLEKFDKLMAVTDLFILDIKEFDSAKHKALTGHPNENILQMAKYCSDHGKKLWIRHVLVPNLTDDEQGLKGLADFIDTLKTVERVEILPYHTLGVFKWKKIGVPYTLEDVEPPTDEEVEKAQKLLHCERYVYKRGTQG